MTDDEAGCKLKESLRSDSLRSKETPKLDGLCGSLLIGGSFSVRARDNRHGESVCSESSSSMIWSVASSEKLPEVVWACMTLYASMYFPEDSVGQSRIEFSISLLSFVGDISMPHKKRAHKHEYKLWVG